MKFKKVLAALAVLTVSVSICSQQVFADVLPNSDYNGSNYGDNNYGGFLNFYSSPIKSYLTKLDDGSLMRFQASSDEEKYLVEYYSAEYEFVSSKTINAELALFGGFYASADNYYVLTGQKNYEESDEVEVFRVTKYDKDWNRMGSVGLYGANTTIPFDAGTARMADDGKYLYIRTCHEMYTSDDGSNHQANVTIQVDMEKMEIHYAGYLVSYESVGYVSHSFNQFIRFDNDGTFATIDHGDAYPRSVALYTYSVGEDRSWDNSWGFYPEEITEDEIYTNEYHSMLDICGSIGDNYTGVEVGGFEISDTAYIVAGKSIVQDENYTNKNATNIFVSVLPKDADDPEIIWITNYDDESVSNPHLTKISSNRFLLSWEKDKKVYYTELDGNGKQISEIYSFNAYLSDCEPIVANGEVVWYVWQNYEWYDDNMLAFYTINTDDISKNGKHVFLSEKPEETTVITTVESVTTVPEAEVNTDANNETTTSPTVENTANVSTGGSVNTDVNQPTGVILLVLPAAIAAAGVMISKKRR